jgi:mRNA interferase YafQ
MFSIEFTNQYLKDLKLARKRNFNEQKLNDVINILVSGDQLPVRYKDHALSGKLNGLNECQI